MQKVAEEENMSMNQFIASTIGEKLSALETEYYLAARAARASKEKFDAVLASVPDVEPEQFDRI